MKRCRDFLLICNVLLATVTVAIFDVQPINAVTEDYADVINNAPVGLDIAKYFDVGKYQLPAGVDATQYPFQQNSANVYQSSDPNDEHNNRVLNLAMGGQMVNSSADTSGAIELSQTGAAWSKIDDDTANYIDISKKQTISVWLYFGAGYGKDSRENGEGMSLTLHNDPRGTSAMGAGYQGMGVLGSDSQRVTEENPLLGNSWSLNTSAIRHAATPEEAAATAVSKSIALDFNSQLNNLISTDYLIAPIKIGTGTNYKGDGLIDFSTYRPLFYSLGSFGTVYSTYPPPKEYPAYDNLMNWTNLGSFPLRLGNNGSAYGVISLTYPGNSLTYRNIPLTNLRADNKIDPLSKNTPWDAINKSSKGTGMSTYQAAAKGTSLTNGLDEHRKDIYWHHVTYTWTPAENGSPATISYDFNDKYPDGTINTGQSRDYTKISTTIPVDPSVFGNPVGNKVYWGLTGANSDLADTYSKLAVFESIPALVTAKVNTKISDVSVDPIKVIEDGTTDNVVGNGHDVQFNYNIVWDDTSRKDWSNIEAEINLPIDVDYTDATITFHNAAGSSAPITIANSADMSDHVLNYTIARLGKIASSDGYTSADIVVNGKANNQTGVPLTEDPEPATFSGDNAIETTSTPKFVIDSNQPIEELLELEVSNNLAFQDVNYQVTQEYLQRKTPFTLKVKNLNQDWELKVSSDGLNNGEQEFYGNVVYKHTVDSMPLTLDDSLQQIASGDATDTTTVSDLSSTWSNESGLLLQPNSRKIMPAGKYTGTLIWELDDIE